MTTRGASSRSSERRPGRAKEREGETGREIENDCLGGSYSSYPFPPLLSPSPPSSIEVPPELLARVDGSQVQGPLSVDKVVNHFELVHYQLLRLRTALALATVTGRAVIMPPFWCELDK